MTRSFIVLFLTLAALNSSLCSDLDRPCGKDLTKLWLDIVAVVNNSAGVTEDDLKQIGSNITAVFKPVRIGTNSSDPRTTRVGIVTYNSGATVKADLNAFQSTNSFVSGIQSSLKTSNQTKSYFSDGLVLATNMLNDDRAFRKNYKKVIILFASAYQVKESTNPVAIADRIKSSGITIVTVGIDQQFNAYSLQKIASIASPRFNFTTSDPLLVTKLQTALSEVNCFCPTYWTQYRTSFEDESSSKHGVCLWESTLHNIGAEARLNCRHAAPDGYLATEQTKHKHDFIFDMIKANPSIDRPYSYFIGLSYGNNGWFWNTPEGLYRVPLNQNVTFWNKDFPASPPTSLSVVLNHEQEGSNHVGWENVNPFEQVCHYVCEVAACDTDRYCE